MKKKIKRINKINIIKKEKTNLDNIEKKIYII
jgi:hypothetical protein